MAENEIRIKVVADADLAGMKEAEVKAKESGAKTGKGFEDKLKDELGRGVPVIAGKAGDDIDEGITSKTKGTGEKAGKQIASEVGRSLNTLLRNLQLPEVDVKANATEALAELQLVKERVRALHDDNPSIEVKVRTERAMTEIDKFAKNFVTDGEQAATSFFGKFTQSLGQQFEGFSISMPQVGAVLGAVAAAAAPGIGATIAGAVIGGVGLGGIAGGVMLAVHDPKVQSALAVMKAQVGKDLGDAAQPFVDVTAQGITRLGRTVETINFKGILADSAQNVEPIINGVTTAVAELGKGIEDVVHNSGPVMKELGQDIGGIGTALGNGLQQLSGDSQQGAAALHQLFGVVDAGVTSIFGLIDGLSKTYGFLTKISGGGLLGQMEGLSHASTDVAAKTRDMAAAYIKTGIPALDSFGRKVLTDGESLNQLAESSFTAANAQLGLFGDLTSVARAQDNAAKAAKANGRTLDANTEKGRANRTALEQLGSSLVKNSEDYYALNGAGTATQKVMANNRAAFLRAAESMTKSKKEAEALTNAIFGIPNKDVYINVHQVSDGRERVDQSGHRIGGYYAHGGIVGAAASGGPRSGLTMVGERGPELLNLPPGTSVHTNGDSMRMLGRGAQGDIHVILSWDKAGLTGLPAALTETIRAEVRAGGGNVQQFYGVDGA